MGFTSLTLLVWFLLTLVTSTYKIILGSFVVMFIASVISAVNHPTPEHFRVFKPKTYLVGLFASGLLTISLLSYVLQYIIRLFN